MATTDEIIEILRKAGALANVAPSKPEEQSIVDPRATGLAGMGMDGVMALPAPEQPQPQVQPLPTTIQEVTPDAISGGSLEPEPLPVATPAQPPEPVVEQPPPPQEEVDPGITRTARGHLDQAQDVEGAASARAEQASVLGAVQALTGERQAALAAEGEAAAQRQLVAQQAIRQDFHDRRQRANAMPEPDFWGDKSTANKIGTAITAFLSGFMAPKMGGRNVFLEQMNRSIERSWAAHEQRIRRELNALDADERMALGITDTQAKLEQMKVMHAVSGYDRVLGMLQGKATELGGMVDAQMLMAQADEIRAILGDKEADWLFKQMKLSAAMMPKGGGGKTAPSNETHISSAMAYDPARGVLVDMSTMDLDQANDLRKYLYRGFVGVDTSTGQSFTQTIGDDSDRSKKMNEAIDNYRAARQRVQRIVGLLDDTKGLDRIKIGAWSPEGNAALLASEFTQFYVALKNAWELGAIQKPDMFLLEGAAGKDPTTLRSWIADTFDGQMVREVMVNFQAGAEEQVIASLRQSTGLLDESRYTFEIPKTRVGEDIQQRKEAASEVDKTPHISEAKKVLDEMYPEPRAAGNLDVRSLEEYRNEVKVRAESRKKLYEEWIAGAKAGVGLDVQEGEDITGGSISNIDQVVSVLRREAERDNMNRKWLNKEIRKLELLARHGFTEKKTGIGKGQQEAKKKFEKNLK